MSISSSLPERSLLSAVIGNQLAVGYTRGPQQVPTNEASWLTAVGVVGLEVDTPLHVQRP